MTNDIEPFLEYGAAELRVLFGEHYRGRTEGRRVIFEPVAVPATRLVSLVEIDLRQKEPV